VELFITIEHSVHNNTTGATSGAGTLDPPGGPVFTPGI